MEAGRQLLTEAGPSEFLEVKLIDACKRAGYTTGAAYPIWKSQRGYQRDLAHYVAANFEWAGSSAIEVELLEIVATSSGLEETIRRAAPLYLHTVVTNEDFYIALRFCSVREPSEELSSALLKGYEIVHTSFVELFSGVLELYQRRVRAPFTVDQVTAAITGLTEGLALRHRIEPDMVTPTFAVEDHEHRSTLYAEALLAIAIHFTEPIPPE